MNVQSKFKVIISLLIIFFTTKVNGQVDSLEYVVLNSSFDNLIFHLEYPPPPPMISDANQQDSIEYEKVMKLYQKNKAKYNKLIKVVLLYDNLVSIDTTELAGRYSESFDKEIVKIIKNSNKKTEKIDFKKIAKSGKWLLKPQSVKQSENEYPIVKAYFSRVVFNNSKTKAAFTYSLNCGRDCGHKDLIFMKKINGKWSVIERITLWVS